MTQQNSGISRRSFLKGAGVTAAGAAAMGALSGCGKGTVAAASEVDVREGAGNTNGPSWLGEPPEIAESEITETVNDYEIVVVGCRTAGLPAMISAAENGAKVLGVDRTSAVLKPREDIGAINSKLQQESFAEFPQFEIDKFEAMEDIVRYANGFVDYNLIKLWCDKSGEMLDWMTDIVTRDGRMTMNFEGSVGTEGQGARDKAWATGHSPEITAKGKEDENFNFGVTLKEYAEELGGVFRWNTEFIKLEQDSNDKVTGIICRDTKDRHYVRINASKGVILCTGGYGNNLEMMEDRQSWNQSIRVACSGNGGNPTGDGIKAALWAGGWMDPLGAACTFNRASVKPDEYAGDGIVGKFYWFGEQPFMKVNLEGKRFCNESGPYDYMLHSTIMQPHQTYCDIFDSDYAEQVKQMNEVGCCRLYPFDNGAPSNMDISLMPKFFDSLMENGYLQQADTPEELAQKLNIPVDTFVETFNHYNEMAEAGEDTDYHKEAYRLMALKTPPYYGIRTGAWFLATLDGVRINTNMQVIRKDGSVIEGLYAAGDTSGGFFSVSYPNLFTGLACGRTMLWGKRAAKHAATGSAD